MSSSGSPRLPFKRIILLSERERFDVQYIPKTDLKRYPQGFKYSFNYRAFALGRWIPLVRWDNSHNECHIDIHGSKVRLEDKERSVLQSFEELSDSVVEELDHIRSIVRSALANEDIKSVDAFLRSLMK